MRITMLTPGTGHFYCGNCLRENTLARALRDQGHDVTMIPLYLPLFTERDGSPDAPPVFMGGVNLFLQQTIPGFGWLPHWLTGWLDRPGLLRWSSKQGDMTDAAKHANMAISMMKCEDHGQHAEIRRMLAWMREHDPPDVISLCNVLLAGLAGPIKEELDVPITCNLHGEDAFLDSFPGPKRDLAWSTLREKIKPIDAFIPVSDYFGKLMAERLDILADKLRVVHNGIDLEGLSRDTSKASYRQTTLGYLARMCEDKGLPTLVDAFIELKRRASISDLRLSVGGVMLKPDEKLVRNLKDRLDKAGCLEDAEFKPNLDREEKVKHLRAMTVLSVPATYGEAFGLYVLEALACGVPVVQPRHGAFPELLERTGGGLLCEPDNPISLADEIERILRDDNLRIELGEAGMKTVHSHFTAARMASDVADVYTGLLASPAPAASAPATPCPA